MAFQLNLPVDHGAYVLAVTNHGPAEGAGIREGEVIVSVDGRAVDAASDLGSILDSLDPGQTIPVEVVSSDGSRRTVNVTLGTRPLPAGNLP
jgi:putative serine protease PepD